MSKDIMIARIPDTAVDDLLIKDGDFVVDESKHQDAYLIMRLHPGNVKQSPLAGFGEERLLNGTLDGSTRKEIQAQLEADNIRVRAIKITDNGLVLDYV